ncbi:MAG: peptidase T [Chloroflexota bacterium]
MAEKVLDKLLRYVKIDTQSSEKTADVTPSTEKQFDLARLLVDELKSIGVPQVELDEHCYVYATIPSNAGDDVPAIGFVAHVDTSPDVSGANVKPNVIERYAGGDIVLPGDSNVVIRESENPHLKECVGHTIVTSDGTTLLGSDDKSGCAAIMKIAETLMGDPTIKHGEIKIAFTPDEEIGQGTKFFNLDKFKCEYAYTLDGDMPGELNKETFSANAAVITTYGRDIHPGMAKDIMVNSLRAMADIVTRFPKDMAPETTDGYEPYIHPHSLEGGVSKSVLKILLRDFKTEGLDVQRKALEKIIEEVKPHYPKTNIELKIIEMYRNMYDKLTENPKGLDYLWEAAERAGVKPYWKPIRGGTDGSRLTEMGLPCPNIYTGGQNFHSRTEWVSINALETAVDTCMHLIEIWRDKK